jgi:hypothetical protein
MRRISLLAEKPFSFSRRILLDGDIYRAGKYEEFHSHNIFLHKCANQKRKTKTDFYILLKKRPYFTGYMLQILLHFVVMITMKDKMFSADGSYEIGYVELLLPESLFSGEATHQISCHIHRQGVRHGFLNSYMPRQSTKATPQTLCDGELHMMA